MNTQATDSALTARTWYDDTGIAAPETSGDSGPDTVFDVAIIGGGLAGLTLLLKLVEAGQNVILLERSTIGSGASGRNGGFCTSGWAADQNGLRRVLGQSGAKEMSKLAVEGIAWMKARMQRPDYAGTMPVDGELMVSLSGQPPQNLAPDETLLTQGDLADQFSSQRYRYGVYSPVGLHFHPLNFMRCLAAEGLAKGGKILENTPLLRLESGTDSFRLFTGKADIQARQVVYATGGYGGRETGVLASHLLPIRTYIGVSDPMPDLLDTHIKPDWAIGDSRRAGNYYRRLHDGRLLWGMAITAFGTLDVAHVKTMIARDLKAVYPGLAQDMRAKNKGITYGWAGNMAYAPHFLPYVGPLGEGLFALSGFGGHGMNTAPIAAIVLAEHMTGQSDRLSPFRQIPLRRTFGNLGRVAAELSYRLRRSADWLAERRT